jgi:hypothetical protein
MVKLAGTPPERSAEVDGVRPCRGRIVLRLPADSYGGRFQVRIPLDALATACTAPDWIWISTRTRVRRGRH